MGYLSGLEILGTNGYKYHPAVFETEEEAKEWGLAFMWEKQLAVNYHIMYTERPATHKLVGGKLEEKKAEVP